jgi:hypothetical protein
LIQAGRTGSGDDHCRNLADNRDITTIAFRFTTGLIKS